MTGAFPGITILAAFVFALGLHAPPRCDAGSIAVPNASFESPTTVFVDTNLDSWQKSVKPPSYDESGGYLWSQLTGAFKNPDPSASDHIDNCHGSQALWLFAVPEVAIFQDYDSRDWNDPAPSHAFNATFAPGKSYQLSAAIMGGGGGMRPGTTLELSLYYRSASGTMLTVASMTVVNSLDAFPTNTHFVDFHVRLPTVLATDPCAGKKIGILVRSTVAPENQGGYWDIDNVRLDEFVEPPSLDLAVGPIESQLSWQSTTGCQYQIEQSLDLQHWTLLGPQLNGSGDRIARSFSNAGATRQFFRLVITIPP